MRALLGEPFLIDMALAIIIIRIQQVIEKIEREIKTLLHAILAQIEDLFLCSACTVRILHAAQHILRHVIHQKTQLILVGLLR